MYEIDFTTEGAQTVDQLDCEERQWVRQRLQQIAAAEFRHPTEWDFRRMPGPADGRFRLGDFRVFADVDERARVIIVRYVGRRENLYT